MSNPRDTYNAAKEHQRQPGWSRGHIKQVGRRTTRDAAHRWEDEQRKKGKPTGP